MNEFPQKENAQELASGGIFILRREWSMSEIACKTGSQASITETRFILQLRWSAEACKQSGKKMFAGKFALLGWLEIGSAKIGLARAKSLVTISGNIFSCIWMHLDALQSDFFP